MPLKSSVVSGGVIGDVLLDTTGFAMTSPKNKKIEPGRRPTAQLVFQGESAEIPLNRPYIESYESVNWLPYADLSGYLATAPGCGSFGVCSDGNFGGYTAADGAVIRLLVLRLKSGKSQSFAEKSIIPLVLSSRCPVPGCQAQ